MQMSSRSRISLEIEGIVQGVGFRPFVYRLAARHALSGWVKNLGGAVLAEVEGEAAAVAAFREEVVAEAPPLAVIATVEVRQQPVTGGRIFQILESDKGEPGGGVSPDCDVCDDCLAELFDPADRRYLYPFINCTNCGPRYSIITAIPYDRPATTMAPFPMCPDCLREYHDPGNRRFHAQPNACPVCGPALTLRSPDGAPLPGDPLETAVAALQRGEIVALKGIGGYHLAVDPLNPEAVRRLRERKKRDEKPFALMFPDLDCVRRYVECPEKEGRLLAGVERPIVLLKKLPRQEIAEGVAPGNGWFGVMLPGTPLHHLLLRGIRGPLVMTSGNLSDEPIAYRDEEAVATLSGIADLFLTHNREIHTRTDDSVLRLFAGEPLFIRRSRGYVPRAVLLPAAQPAVLAVGGELKGTLCLTRDRRAFMSQHIGDLKNAATAASLSETALHLQRLLEIEPQVVAHDLHPDYLSTAFAEELDLPRVAVQHHHAHMASCMAEHGLDETVIGVILDGTGYGSDGTIWGGEFLVGDYRSFTRAGYFAHLRLPGGDAAVKEPYRMALSALYAVYGAALFEQPLEVVAAVAPAERPIFLKMLERGINSPFTSSCGRLFDAVSALIGVRGSVSYEGQAAIELEALAERGTAHEPYPFRVIEGEGHVLDFAPTVSGICSDLQGGRDRGEIARAFHRTVAAAVLTMCGAIRRESGVDRVVLSGGVFQNRLLTEDVFTLLGESGFTVHSHRLVPPNDGGIALGQAVIAGRTWKE